MKGNSILTIGRDAPALMVDHAGYQFCAHEGAIAAEAQRRFAVCNQLYADQAERDERTWLTTWSGQQWGDEPPNRLFGSWVNQDGEAV